MFFHLLRDCVVCERVSLPNLFLLYVHNFGHAESGSFNFFIRFTFSVLTVWLIVSDATQCECKKKIIFFLIVGIREWILEIWYVSQAEIHEDYSIIKKYIVQIANVCGFWFTQTKVKIQNQRDILPQTTH